jgi:AbrB family looped-hinge helix DNA binding protein
MKAKVAERGQVTIPKALRERLGIVPGTVLDFFEEQGRLIAKLSFCRQSGMPRIPNFRDRLLAGIK